MTDKLDEQQQRHAATMAFFQSASDAWDEIKELLNAENEQRKKIESDWQARRCRPVKDESSAT